MKTVYKVGFVLVSGQQRVQQPRIGVIANSPSEIEGIIKKVYPQAQIDGYEMVVPQVLDGTEEEITIASTDKVEGFNEGAIILSAEDPFTTGHKSSTFPGTQPAATKSGDVTEASQSAPFVSDPSRIEESEDKNNIVKAEHLKPADPGLAGEARSPISTAQVPPETGEMVTTSKTGSGEATEPVNPAAIPKAELNSPMPHPAADFPNAAKPINSGNPEVSPVEEIEEHRREIEERK